MPNTPKIPKYRVLLVDSHGIFSAGVANILQGTEFEMVAAAGAAEAILLSGRLWPDIIMLDLRMEGIERWELLELLTSTFPASLVLLVTITPDAAYRAHAFAGGAVGYMDKGSTALALLEALRALARGEYLFRPEDIALPAIAAAPPALSFPMGLSRREQDVLRQLTTGKSNRVIGLTLFVSEETVKSHVARILHKLDMPGRTQAAIWAVQHGYGLLPSGYHERPTPTISSRTVAGVKR